ncbi:MAG: hypothetical protein AAGE01_03550, partial [Pseudomonadota bacterium]
TPELLADGAALGSAVAIAGDRVAGGAPGLGEAGAVFLIEAGAREATRLAPLAGQDAFGAAVGISASTVVSGAPATSASAGAASAFRDPDLVFRGRFE